MQNLRQEAGRGPHGQPCPTCVPVASSRICSSSSMINGGVRRIRVCTRCLRSNKSPKPPRMHRCFHRSATERWGRIRRDPAGQFLFVSGQVPIDRVPANSSGRHRGSDPARPAERRGNSPGGGTSFQQVVRTTVIGDLADFSAMNEVYATFSRRHSPRDRPSRPHGCQETRASRSTDCVSG